MVGIRRKSDTCVDCGLGPRNDENFYRVEGGKYFQSRCKNCLREYTKKYDNRNSIWRWRGINITVEEYEAMIIVQNNKCLICNRPPPPARRLTVRS